MAHPSNPEMCRCGCAAEPPLGHSGPLTCFYCHKGIAALDAYISWMGASAEDLTLHPACVWALMARIVRDVHEYECLSNTDRLAYLPPRTVKP